MEEEGRRQDYMCTCKKNKTPRARGGKQWRPDSSCWSWRRRRSTWPRRRALNVSALTALKTAQDAGTIARPSDRLHHPPGTAQRTASTGTDVSERAKSRKLYGRCVQVQQPP
eukprot:scaffold5654_cov119-Isochrysis_galbana.AAC.2